MKEEKTADYMKYHKTKYSGSQYLHFLVLLEIRLIGLIIWLVWLILQCQIVKYGWKGIMSIFLFIPVQLFDPVRCRNSVNDEKLCKLQEMQKS